MRKIYKLLLLLLLGTAGIEAIAQTTIGVNNQYFVYLGIENPISLNVAGIPFSSLRFTCSNGVIRTSEGKLFIKPRTKGAVILSIYNGSKLIKKLTYNALLIPTPVACINGKTSGNITIAEVLKAGKLSLTARPDNQYKLQINYDSLFTISSFETSDFSSSGDYSHKNDGANFDNETLRFLQWRDRTKTLHFEEIKITDKEGNIRELPMLIFKIKSKKAKNEYETK